MGYAIMKGSICKVSYPILLYNLKQRLSVYEADIEYFKEYDDYVMVDILLNTIRLLKDRILEIEKLIKA